MLIGRGPLGAGMEEVYQVTSALKYLDVGKTVALLTDARFSGVSTGPCIGHVGPEALAGGPIGRLRDGDRIRVVVDRRAPRRHDRPGRPRMRQARTSRPTSCSRAARCTPTSRRTPICRHATRLWAALQNVSGGAWGGCVYDVDAIVESLQRR